MTSGSREGRREGETARSAGETGRLPLLPPSHRLGGAYGKTYKYQRFPDMRTGKKLCRIVIHNMPRSVK